MCRYKELIIKEGLDNDQCRICDLVLQALDNLISRCAFMALLQHE